MAVHGLTLFIWTCFGCFSPLKAEAPSSSKERELWQQSLHAPASPEGQRAARILLALAQKRPDQATDICERLLLIPQFQQGAFGEELRQVLEVQAYRKIHRLPGEQEQARGFAQLYQRNPKGASAKRSLLRAVQLFEKQGQLDRALSLLELHFTLDADEPDRAFLRQEMLRISDKAMLWSQARIYVKELMLLEPKSELRGEWRTQLCRYDQMVAPEEAGVSCALEGVEKTEQWNYSQRLQARGEVYAMAQILKSSYLLRQDLSLEERLHALIALANEESLSLRFREEAVQETLQIYAEHLKTLSPEARELVASIAYQSLKDSYQRFARMSVQAVDRESFLTALQSQKQSYDQLEQLSQRVWKVKDARWSSLVLLEMAQASLHFSNQLQNPPRMEAVDSKQLTAELKTREAGLKAKAKAHLATAEKAMNRYGILQDSNREILRLSRELRDSPVKFEDKFPTPAWVSYEN